MAKLSSCYQLCPLIDRSPIGVTPDTVPGCAIVTLGKNIVIRYKLADQKQASSWSCKDKLTAPVIFDSTGKQYVAVFNQSILRLWDNIDVDLNRVKKQKFDQPIYTILNRTSNAEPIVVFKNGAAVSLSIAVADRKKLWPGPLSADTNIKECYFSNLEGTDCVLIIAVNDKSQTTLVVAEVDAKKYLPSSLQLERPEKRLLGQTTMLAEGTISLLTFWDDGQLYSLPLKRDCKQLDGVGGSIFTVKAVSQKDVVAMTQISTHHLAIYGADPSEEGAMLVIVNTQFNLVQAHQHYKLFSNSTSLWLLGSSLLLVVGHSLAVVPFVLDTERLSALIGSHKPTGPKGGEIEEILEVKNVSWENDGIADSSDCLKNIDRNSPESVARFMAQGYSQSLLCEQLVPSLLEDSNISALLWLLKNLSDFPESALAQILVFCLDAPEDVFKGCKNDYFNDADITELDGDDSRDSQNTLVELSSGQRFLLDIIIRTPFSEAIMLPLLRSRLNLSHCLALLQYVAQSLPQTKSISYAQSLLQWAAILLDSHYQQLLLSKDECVSSTVTALKELVESQVEYMDDLRLLHPLLERIKSGQPLHNPNTVTNHFYSIETLRLY